MAYRDTRFFSYFLCFGVLCVAFLLVPLHTANAEEETCIINSKTLLGVTRYTSTNCSMGEWMEILDPCLQDKSKCTENDLKTIEALNAICNGSYPGRICPTDTTSEHLEKLAELGGNANESVSTPASQGCGTLSALFSITCWFRTISVVLGTILVTATAWLLAIAGILFDFLIDKTIVQFGAYYNEYLKAGIEVGWEAFRDIGNIVIIGMFTFIAISLILGIQEYGDKKMIAKVLVVAVLINFSLLFTKVIIDASNFTAKQFHVAAQLPATASNETTGVDPRNFAQTGTAGKFITYMGITSLSGTWSALSNTAFGNEKDSFATADGTKALLHGLFSAALLLAAALVFLYGSYILLTRALLFIFLMLTSALAFASWLIPKLAGHEYLPAWSTWWNALIKNAILAPLLMVLLWASLEIGAKVSVKNGTLGALIENPASTFDLNALFSYLVVLGLLFVSMRLAGVLASGITGFGYTQRLIGGAALTGLAVATRPAGLVARSTVGRFGARGKELVNSYYDWAGRDPGLVGRGVLQGFHKLSTGTFDVMNTKAMQKLGKEQGAYFSAGTVGKGGYEGVKQRQAEEAAKLSAAIRPMTDARKEIMRQAELGKQTESRGGINEKRGKVESGITERGAKAAEQERRNQQQEREAAEATIARHREEARQAQDRRTAAESEARIAETQAGRAQDPAERAAATRQAQAARLRMNAEDQHIRESQERAEEHQQTLTRLDRNVQEVRNRAEAEARGGKQGKQLARLNEQAATLDKRVADAASGARFTKKLAHSRLSTAYGTLGIPETDPAAKRVPGAMRKSSQRERALDLLNAAEASGARANQPPPAEGAGAGRRNP